MIDPLGRTLLFRGIDPTDDSRESWWFTPGGGVEDGEELIEAAAREILEETGLRVEEFGPVVLHRRTVFDFTGSAYDSHETTFLLELDEPLTISTGRHSPLEQSAILEHRWMAADEIRALAEPYYPDCLADLLERIVAIGPPPEPWFELDGRR